MPKQAIKVALIEFYDVPESLEITVETKKAPDLSSRAFFVRGFDFSSPTKRRA